MGEADILAMDYQTTERQGNLGFCVSSGVKLIEKHRFEIAQRT
jgi:hypothetical protein